MLEGELNYNKEKLSKKIHSLISDELYCSVYEEPERCVDFLREMYTLAINDAVITMCFRIMEMNPIVDNVNAGMGSIAFWIENKYNRDIIREEDLAGYDELHTFLSDNNGENYVSFDLYRDKEGIDSYPLFEDLYLTFSSDKDFIFVEGTEIPKNDYVCEINWEYNEDGTEMLDIFDAWNGDLPVLENILDPLSDFRLAIERHLDKSAGIWLVEQMLIYVANYNFR
jgi:hypothetical protein